jgi:hypothetical protein
MPTDWTEKVKAAITDLEIGGRVLESDRALVIIDDVEDGKLAVAELGMIHGIPQNWVGTTLGHVTRAVQGTGRVLPLDAGGWYALRGPDQPYEVAPVSPLPGRRRGAPHDQTFFLVTANHDRFGSAVPAAVFTAT